MLKRALYKILLLALVSTFVFNLSCKQSKEESNISTLPTFDDTIPYHLLGHGKLVFKRVGPNDEYRGFYVISIDQRRSWNIDLGFAVAPSVSPNGDKIAFVKSAGVKTIWDIYTIDIDGKNQVDITNLIGSENVPTWTFDGSHILFTLDRFYSNTNNINALYRQSPVPNPTDTIQIIDLNAIVPPTFLTGVESVSSSLTGKLLVLTSGLRTFDADGSNMKLILPNDENSDHTIYSPAWSPDGSKIAVLSYKRNSDIAVVLYDPDGTHPDTLISLTASGTEDWFAERNQVSLCWSPDGSKIAFTRPDGLKVGSHIYIIGKDHTGLAQVTFAAGVTDFSLSWSH